jgi:DNA adenine methylase
VHRKLPHAGNAGTGVHRKRPHAGNAGTGVHRAGVGSQRPHLGSGGQGNGVHGLNGVSRQLPATNIGGDAAYGDGGPRREMLITYFRQLAARLERVRVICGDWTRVLGPSVTYKHGMTAVFLDPPYSHAERDSKLYSHDSDVAADVRQWAIENGDNPQLRIALCGYDTEHGDAMPDTWSVWRWKAAGGYGSQGNGRGRANAGREAVWFNPACINPLESLPLFRTNGNGVTDHEND